MASQKTLKKETSFSGKALFTGKDVSVRLLPAPVDQGVLFRRIDLSNSSPIPAHIDYLGSSLRSTKIGKGEVSVQTIEHFMAAIRACEIDNLSVEISGPEMPIFDGSAVEFIKILQSAAVVDQEKEKEWVTIEKPLYWSDGNRYLILLPSDEYRISYTLYHPHSSAFKWQYYSSLVNLNQIVQEIAPSRTFAFYTDLVALMNEGVLAGAGMENGVVIEKDRVLNPEGLRFPEEFARHKILDMIGDFGLVRFSFFAHLIAMGTGHKENHIMAKQLVDLSRKK